MCFKWKTTLYFYQFFISDENPNLEQNIFDNHIKSLIKILISNYESHKLNKEILKSQPYKTQEDLLIK